MRDVRSQVCYEETNREDVSFKRIFVFNIEHRNIKNRHKTISFFTEKAGVYTIL